MIDFIKLNYLFGTIGLACVLFQALNYFCHIVPVLPIPGSGPGKYDGFLTTHCPAFVGVIAFLVHLLTAFFLLPGFSISSAIYQMPSVGGVLLGYVFNTIIWAGLFFALGLLSDCFRKEKKERV